MQREGDFGGWKNGQAANYCAQPATLNYVVSSSGADIQQSYGGKHRGGNRWEKGKSFPLLD